MEHSEPAAPRLGDAGQRRRVTLLFSDLCDYTQLNELIDPEDIDALRSHLEEAASRIIQRLGGTVTQYYGDGILAVFGLPEAGENDVRGAVQAAIELRALPAELCSVVNLPAGFSLALHSGVHCGLVFARRGDSLHGRYQLTGDAVNTAARLCAAAARDQVLVSETAMRGIEPFFESDVVETLTLKGKRLSVPAFRVHAPSNVRTRFEASTRMGLTQYVGRDEVLTRLASLLQKAPEATCVAAISGGAGIGKTRLVEEFRRRHLRSDVSFYRVTCEPDGSAVPLQPWLKIVRELLDMPAATHPSAALDRVQLQCLAAGPGIAAHAPLLANVLTLGTGSERSNIPRLLPRLVEAVRALLGALPTPTVVLVFDDWQWVDELSRQLLREIVCASPRGLFALLAAREWQSCDALLDTAQRIEVTPLSHDESASVVRTLLAEPVALGLRDSLLQRAGGNPLFLEELCRSLPVSPSDDALARAVPPTVHGVIQARLQRLPEGDHRLLQVASVIGNEFGAVALQEVAAPLGKQSSRHGQSALSSDSFTRAALDRLVAADIVREAEEPQAYRFKHGITRDVVYESVRLADRKRWHAGVAAYLESCAAEGGTTAPHEALAHHYRASGEHARAAQHAELAGDRAAAASALDRARLQYATALAALDELPRSADALRRWLAVSVKWARAWVYNPSPELRAVLERARDIAQALGDLRTLVDVEQMSAWMCYALGEQACAITHGQRGLALAVEIGADKLIGQLNSNLGQSFAAAGDYTQALRLLDRGMQVKRELATKREGAIPVGFAYAFSTLAAIHVERGDIAHGRGLMTQALAAVHGSGHAIEASMLAVAAMTLLWQGAFEECSAACERASAAAERVLGPYIFHMSEAMGAYCRFMLDRSASARAQLESSARWIEARHMGLYLSVVYGCAAEVCLLGGDAVQARHWCERALMRAVQDDPFGQAPALRVLAELRVRETGCADEHVYGWLDEAEHVAARRASRRESALNQWCRARVLAATGQLSAACVLDDMVLRELETMGMCHRLDRHRGSKTPTS